MRRFFRNLSIVALVSLSAFGLAALYIVFYEPDRSTYPVRGIDVSHHQDVIDWRKVAADDVSFAFIKASEGGDHRDRRFAINWIQAREAGLKVGAYHFFTFCRPGGDQARNFLAALDSRRSDLAPALDLEFGGNCAAKPEPDLIKAEIDSFIGIVEGCKRAFARDTSVVIAAGRDFQRLRLALARHAIDETVLARDAS